MADFSLQITNFEKDGEFNYQFDEVGNIILNPSSSKFQQNYISLPLSNVNYDNNKLLSFYDPTFTEFIRSKTVETGSLLPTEVSDQISLLETQNQELQSQLDMLIVKTESNSSDAEKQAIKDIILELRIQLGQGTSSEDFEKEFPYLPIPLENKDNAPA